MKKKSCFCNVASSAKEDAKLVVNVGGEERKRIFGLQHLKRRRAIVERGKKGLRGKRGGGAKKIVRRAYKGGEISHREREDQGGRYLNSPRHGKKKKKKKKNSKKRGWSQGKRASTVRY